MKKVLIIMFLILTGVANIYGKEEAGKKEKISMLAYGAILTVRNEDNFTRLGTDITEDKEILAENWEITNRKQAIDALEWLVNEGHRKESDEVLKILQAGKAGDYEGLEDAEELYNKSNKMLITEFKMDKISLDKLTVAAWDCDRLVNVARWCYDAKYITEAEAWSYIEKAKKIAQESFTTWDQYYASNVYGRSIAYGGDPSELFGAGKTLLRDKNSIWKTVKFK